MEIPGLGRLRRDDELGAHASTAVPLRLLHGQPCRVVIGEEYFLDPNQPEFHAAVRNLLAAGPEVLEAAAPYVLQHYQRWHDAFGDGAPALAHPTQVWAQLTPAGETFVCRRDHGDRKVYVVPGAAPRRRKGVSPLSTAYLPLGRMGNRRAMVAAIMLTAEA